MKVKVAKWGNSLGLRLPRAAVEATGLVPGAEVDVTIEGRDLRVRSPVTAKYYRLEDLLAQIKPGQRPPPLEDWSAVETPWPDDDWSDIAPSGEEWEAMKRAAQGGRKENSRLRRRKVAKQKRRA